MIRSMKKDGTDGTAGISEDVWILAGSRRKRYGRNIKFVWLPAIALLIATIGFLFYDLDKKYDKVIADLEAGRHRGDQ